MLSLVSEKFPTRLNSTFCEFVTDGLFTDETLVSSDQTEVQAHKVVLSAWSPVLRKMFLNNTQGHTMLYLRGVPEKLLQYILRFMYFGEVTIDKGDVHGFFEFAEDLEVEDLVEKEKRITEKLFMKISL